MGFTGSTATSNSSTALQMVNRVLLNVGQDIVSGFTTTNRSQQALDHINAAARRLFENEGAWDWLVRHDGVLRLYAALDGLTAGAATPQPTNLVYDTGISHAVFVAVGSFVSTHRYDNVGTHIVVTNDADWSDVSFKVDGVFENGGGVTRYRLDANWHSNVSSQISEYNILFPEYLLPPNVATITSAVYQSRELKIEMVDADTSFNQWRPKPHIERGEPEVIAIGGLGNETIEDDGALTVGTTTLPLLRLYVWPVPDDDYVINCAYRIKPTNLSATTDQLLGVPESAIDRIVEIATGTMMLQTHHADPALAAGNLQLAQLNIQKMRALHKPDAGRRRFMRSLDDVGRRSGRIIKRTWGSLDLDG